MADVEGAEIVLVLIAAASIIGGSFALIYSERGGNWIVGYYEYYPYREEGITTLFLGVIAVVGLVLLKKKRKKKTVATQAVPTPPF